MSAASASSFDLQLPHSHAALQQLPEPKNVFKNLLMCLETPRPSNEEGSKKNLEAITNKLVEFGKVHGLDAAVDPAGNVRLRKAATPGYENATKIVVQCHMDVVCSKAADKEHDFTRDPVTPVIEGNILRADRTTLGADDGIGVAAAMALFEDSAAGKFVHGPLEALFTVDEETTMGGAENIAHAPFLQSDVLINVDSEEAHSICVGCAGGMEKKLMVAVQRSQVAADSDLAAIKLNIHSLLGGHTGVDIHRGRANAILLMTRLVHVAQRVAPAAVQLLSFNGGNAVNAIPRDACAELLLPAASVAEVRTAIDNAFNRMKKEFANVERKLAAGSVEGPHASYVSPMVLEVTDLDASGRWAVSAEATERMLGLLLNIPHGPMKMNIELDYAVETSISFSLATLPAQPPSSDPASSEDMLTLFVFCRSSSDDDMNDVEARFDALAKLAGCRISSRLNYFPGWDPKLDSPALAQVKLSHESLFGRAAKVYSVHAGLECGFLKSAYPHMDCVSIGPTIVHAHSPQESLYIDTVQPFYSWLMTSIQNIAKDSTKNA